MNSISKNTIGAVVLVVALFLNTTIALADGVTTTPTKTPTPTPKVDTRVECTTGAYGQQSCKTVVIERTASPSGVPAHKVVNSGIAENIIFTLLAVLVISTFGYTYSKTQA